MAADNVSALCSVVGGIPAVYGFLTAHADYISKFDDNLNDLRRALGDLKAKRDDVVRKVNDEEIKGQRQLHEVKRWRLRVQTVVTDTSLLNDEASDVQQRISTYGYCSSNIFLAYSFGKRISKMLDEVQKLSSENVSQVVTRQATSRVVVKEPVQQTFGLVTELQSTWELLMENDIRMLGLYGMGGVGKTTLLTLICNKFDEVKDDFDVVIWVEVSKDVDIGKIQDDIGKRLGLYDENWRGKTQWEKRVDIGRVLIDRKPRFVLLLDDLWEEVSFNKIGIPVWVEKGEYKIVFTTRSNSVCRRMGGIDREVKCLAEKDALDLLTHYARRDTSTGEMLDLSKEIAEKCYGLPLALEVIGKCLSSKTTDNDWRDVLNALSSYPDVVEGMEKKMFGVLKVSYDYLEKEEDAQSCFKYCALFPMGYKIKQDELVEYWIGEGIIDVRLGRDKAKSRGIEIINTLVGAGLLLKDDESNQKVYMHNMIHQMALSMVSKDSDGKMYLVKTDAGLVEMPDVPWTAVTKMSLMNNKIRGIPDDPEFPDHAPLITLFLQNNRLVEIGCQFFVFMSTLVVLDLSSNPDITKLPDKISELVNLRYLKLLGTRIKDLPEGFGKLLKLVHLDLESTSSLRSISLISGLQKLQVLRFYGSAAAVNLSLLEVLKRLKGLQLLTITVRKNDVLEAFLRSNLAAKTQGLYLDGIEMSFSTTFGELGSLSKLEMIDCDIKVSETEWEENRSHQCSSPSPSPSNQRSPWFKNLSAVVIYSCVGLTDLTWLMYAANLVSLSVKIAPMMKEVINEEKAGNVELELNGRVELKIDFVLPSTQLLFLNFIRCRHASPKRTWYDKQASVDAIHSSSFCFVL
ncbi:unnamed protein product [Microthlaspi erraticum]|uniref:Uncharacterized protein n=1 Tax=Microthlaspi erraticum TaxID=1685480 RepID=A0A6D2II21_9BRAS|nr:unnamed protein product [Microthlaspi erraticum]